MQQKSLELLLDQFKILVNIQERFMIISTPFNAFNFDIKYFLT